MELFDNQQKNKFQIYYSGDLEVTFDNNGYIVRAKNFLFLMWGPDDLDKKLIGIHISELAKMIKKTQKREYYINFLEKVVINFYKKQAKYFFDELEIEKKGKQIIKTK